MYLIVTPNHNVLIVSSQLTTASRYCCPAHSAQFLTLCKHIHSVRSHCQCKWLARVFAREHPPPTQPPNHPTQPPFVWQLRTRRRPPPPHSRYPRICTDARTRTPLQPITVRQHMWVCVAVCMTGTRELLGKCTHTHTLVSAGAPAPPVAVPHNNPLPPTATQQTPTSTHKRTHIAKHTTHTHTHA